MEGTKAAAFGVQSWSLTEPSSGDEHSTALVQGRIQIKGLCSCDELFMHGSSGYKLSCYCVLSYGKWSKSGLKSLRPTSAASHK